MTTVETAATPTGTPTTTARALSGATVGVDAVLVQVEVDLSQQLPAMSTVGLAGAEVKESKDRVRSAIRNSGFKFPARRITVNLAPADLPKAGTAFDLPIAAAILGAAGHLDPERLAGWVLVGELSLEGQLRAVTGVLPVALAARAAGFRLLVPLANGPEAAAVAGLEARTAETLRDVALCFTGKWELPAARAAPRGSSGNAHGADLSQVRGHAIARHAVEIAAAGGHNLLLSGPPGQGKTLLARCLGTILPPMTEDEQLEVTAIHSVAGLLPRAALITERPFRAPHATARPEALVGGGKPLRPGEVTLAHRGVLFLDEFPELGRNVLESLRAPLEDREVNIARAGRRIRFPASFSLVAAMNPCKCGHGGSVRCSCSDEDVRRYGARISGPLLDRIDLQARLEPLAGAEFEGPPPEDSARVRERVVEARARAWARFRKAGLRAGIASNAEIPREAVEPLARLSRLGRAMLAEEVDRGMSGRARERTIRVARTVADLAGAELVSDGHLLEALGLRPATG